LTSVRKPFCFSSSATDCLSLLWGRTISLLRTLMALRMRVSMSAIGSVDTIFHPSFLPTSLCYARNFTLAGVLAERDTAQAKGAHVAMRTAGFEAAVLQAGRAGVAGQLGQTFQVTERL